MAQLGRFFHVVQDTAGNAISGASVTVYREGSTVNLGQSGASPFTVTVRHPGKIVANDTVFINATTGTTYNVNSVSATTVVLSGFAGSLTLANGDRIVPSNNKPTLYADDQAGATTANPLTTTSAGVASSWIEFGAYEIVTSGGGTTTTLFQALVAGSQAPGQIRYADEFQYGSSSGGIQEAINDLPSGGGTVILSGNKTYSISAQLSTITGLTLKGAGPSTIILQATNNTAGISVGASVTIRDLTLRGTNVSGASAHGVNGGNSTDCLVENCVVDQWGGIGINFGSNSTRCVVRRCTVRSNLNEGILFNTGTTECQVLDNLVYSNSNNGIDCIGSRCTISRNIVYSNGSGGAGPTSDNLGIVVGAGSGLTSTDVVVSNNVCRANLRGGIFVWGSAGASTVQRFTISDNLCIGNTGGNTSHGIYFEGGAATVAFGLHTVTGNVCQGNTGAGTDGILMDGVDDTIISGNALAANGRHGLFITSTNRNSTRNVVTGNVMRSNTGTGIITGSATGVLDTIAVNNFVTGNGTNLSFGSSARMMGWPNKIGTADTQNITAVGQAIVITDPVMKLTSDASYTLTSAPTIADGFDKQRVLIINVNAVNSITLQDQGTLASSNLRLSAATIALGPRDSIELMYDSVITDWVQVGQVNVL